MNCNLDPLYEIAIVVPPQIAKRKLKAAFFAGSEWALQRLADFPL
jgi:hypothetical protein